jgi:hypothetical protein
MRLRRLMEMKMAQTCEFDLKMLDVGRDRKEKGVISIRRPAERHMMS